MFRRTVLFLVSGFWNRIGLGQSRVEACICQSFGPFNPPDIRVSGPNFRQGLPQVCQRSLSCFHLCLAQSESFGGRGLKIRKTLPRELMTIWSCVHTRAVQPNMQIGFGDEAQEDPQANLPRPSQSHIGPEVLAGPPLLATSRPYLIRTRPFTFPYC